MSLNHNGKYVVREAGFADVQHVLTNLSKDEAEERDRLGITDFTKTFEECAEGRVWTVQLTTRPYIPLIIFGASKSGYVWLLPTQACVDHHARYLADKRNIRWMLEFCFGVVDALGGTPKVLFNGVTPEGTRIINWLKKVVGARFSATPIKTEFPNGAMALPFFIDRPAHV